MAFRVFFCLLLLSACTPAYSLFLPRTPAVQYEHAARIEVICSYLSSLRVHTGDADADEILNALLPDEKELSMASGVFVSDRHVLTNAHAVTCTRGEKDKDIGWITSMEVVLLDGSKHPATIDVLLPSRDLARVTLSIKLESDIRPPGIGTSPVIGDRICFATAVPRYSYKCATVEPSSKMDRIQLSGIQPEHGNSGASASDSSGRLIGLVRALDICEFGIPCMGQITPITASDAWLVQ